MWKKPLLIGISFLLPILIIAQVDHWETVVYNTDNWSYFIGNSEPPSNWNQANFNDNALPFLSLIWQQLKHLFCKRIMMMAMWPI